MQESSQVVDFFAAVVTGPDGKVKTTRFVKPLWGYRFEFLPNQFYISLINKGTIQPNTWKIPFLFGKWTANKEQ